MSNRITSKTLDAVVDRINLLTGSPCATYTKSADGKYKANVGNYHIYNAYGKYRLARVTNDQGGTTDVLSTGYVSKRELYSLMHAFIQGYYTGTPESVR